MILFDSSIHFMENTADLDRLLPDNSLTQT